jgi:hypothetical protein
MLTYRGVTDPGMIGQKHPPVIRGYDPAYVFLGLCGVHLIYL